MEAIKKLFRKSRIENVAAQRKRDQAERLLKKVEAMKEKIKRQEDELRKLKYKSDLAFQEFMEWQQMSYNSRRQAQREFDKTLSNDLDSIERREAWMTFIDSGGL